MDIICDYEFVFCQLHNIISATKLKSKYIEHRNKNMYDNTYSCYVLLSTYIHRKVIVIQGGEYKMTRNRKLEIRLSEEEYRSFEANAKQAGLKKSDFARTKLFNSNTYIFDKKGMVKSLVNMQTLVNRIVQIGIREDEAEQLLKEMDSLWLYLK